MKIRWSPEALQDRIAIWDYIAQANPLAASPPAGGRHLLEGAAALSCIAAQASLERP